MKKPQKPNVMYTNINVKKMGLAFGLTGALLYGGCMLVMATVGYQGTVTFFNSLLHGLNTAALIRMDVPLWEAGLGLVETFVIAWLTGACIAAIYNAVSKGATHIVRPAGKK